MLRKNASRRHRNVDLNSLRRQELLKWARRAGVESLESRRLLSSVSIIAGVLTVNADGTNDTITLAPGASGKTNVVLNAATSTFNNSAYTAIKVLGNGGNDKVTVSNSITKPATLIGGAGNDSLVGGGGNDVLDGQAGADTMKGGSGNDTADYSSRTANLTIGIGTLADDGEANEKDNVYNDIETVLAGSGNDNLSGTVANNLFRGGGGNDFIQANAGNDTVFGDGGNDSIYPDIGNDSIDAGTGDDYVDAYLGNDTIRGGAGNDTMNGHYGQDSVYGDEGDDVIFGGSNFPDGGNYDGADLLVGGDGNDSIVGGAGNDTLSGDTGTDTLDGSDGTDTAINAAGDKLISIEVGGPSGGAGTAVIINRKLVITGTENADTISIGFDYSAPDDANRVIINGVGTSFPQADFDFIEINALGGDDQIKMEVPQLAFPRPGVTINGGSGNDEVRLLETGVDVINGGDGNDSVFATDAGAKIFNGDAGIDYYEEYIFDRGTVVDLSQMPTTENANVSAQAVTLIGNELNNVLEGRAHSGGSATIKGNGGNDTITIGLYSESHNLADGGNGNDTIVADSGHNTLLGGAGNDSITGGSDDDTIDGGTGADAMKGGAGLDTLDYSSRTAAVGIGPGTQADDGEIGEKDNIATDIETLIGGSGNDTIKGTGEDNLLIGNGGNDSILANYGNDTLSGNAGTDTLNGENGTDTAINSTGDILISIENNGGGGGSGSVVITNRKLIITGTEGADTISIGRDFNADEQFTIRVLINGTATSVEQADYDFIEVNALGGNDKVMINAPEFDGQGPGITINAGNGNDEVRFTEAGANVVNGGEGNDSVFGTDGGVKIFNGDAGVDYYELVRNDSAASVDLTQMPTTEDANVYGQTVTLIGNELNNVLSGTNGSGSGVTVKGNGGNDTISIFGQDPDSHNLADGGSGNDTITGDDGHNTLLGGTGNDSITGGDNDDTIDGGTGADVVKGGTGLDTLTYASRTAPVSIGPGTQADDGEVGEKDNVATDIETLIGGSGNDTIKGTADDNLLIGNGGNDSILASYGNDTLSGDAGTDTLNGESGNDTAINASGDFLISIENNGGSSADGTALITADRTLLITGTEGSDAIGVQGGDPHYTAATVHLNGVTYTFDIDAYDRIRVEARGGNDYIDFSDLKLNNGAMFVDAGAGNDEISCAEAQIKAEGGTGDDQLFPGAYGVVLSFTDSGGIDTFDDIYGVFNLGPDRIFDMRDFPGLDNVLRTTGHVIGNALNNRIEADTDNGVSLEGLGGNDTLIGSSAGDHIDGGEGDDLIRGVEVGAESSVDIQGDTLTGGTGNDTIIGSGGDDSLTGDAGNDSLEGGLANDILDGGAGADLMKGGGGNDTVDYSLRTANVTIGIGTLADDGEAGEHDNVYNDIETVIGGSGNDFIRGSGGDNLLIGNGGNDTIYGNYGNDTLSGNAGTDSLFGEGGDDTATNSAGDILNGIEHTG